MSSSKSLALETAAAEFTAAYPERGHLIIKGLAAAKAGRVTCLKEGTYQVVGAKGDIYDVIPGACTCEARLRCYHRWACNILDRAGLLPTPPVYKRPSAIPTERIVVPAALRAPTVDATLAELWELGIAA